MNFNIQLTQAAKNRMRVMGKDVCYISIRRGGCFGYTTEFSFQPLDNFEYSQNSDQTPVVLCGCQTGLLGIEEAQLTVDYTQSLMQSGFVVSSNTTSNCCCNKSFGRKLSKGNCVQK